MGTLIDETGNRYGRLTVIERAPSENGYARWICQCECGERIVVRGANLRSGNSKSCGCLKAGRAAQQAVELSKSNRLPKGEAALNHLFAIYKKNARRRGYKFNLSQDEFRGLVIQPCSYCGRPPSSVVEVNDSSLIYTGIDRTNNEEGYSIDNCIPCCKICNRAKRGMPYEEFMIYLDDLVAFRSRCR